MIEPKFFLSAPKKALELRMSQERDWNNESASVLSNVDCEMAFWHIEREAIVIVAMFLSQARAPLEDLLEDCSLCQFV